MKTAYDDRLIRCPKLGDEMTFAYCRREAGNLPCARIIRCWTPFFDVEKFLKDTLAPEKWEAFVNAKAPDKMTSLIDLIATAREKR